MLALELKQCVDKLKKLNQYVSISIGLETDMKKQRKLMEFNRDMSHMLRRWQERVENE